MVIRAIEHVQLAIPAGGEPEARAFYPQLLGLAEVPKPAELAANGGCWFELGSVKVHVGVDREFRPAKKAHPRSSSMISMRSSDLDDLDALERRMADAGVAIRPDSPVDGYRRFFVDDPFGNRIELMQPAT